MTGLIYLVGIGVTLFIVYAMVEFVWQRAPHGHLADAFAPADSAQKLSGLRGALAPLDKPVQKFASPVMLRKISANLYWAQMGGKWLGWNAVQYIGLQIAAVTAALVGGSILTRGDPVFTGIAALVAFNFPGISLNGAARRTRRNLLSQLPEFIQLVSAQMAANVSIDQAIRRVSKAPSLVGAWMRNVIQQSQGRDLIEQIQREAQESLMPELIGMGVQLSFIKRGTAQQELMGQLAISIASEYIGQAEQRAEKLGSELVVPMVVFYFIPFLVTIMIVIGYPVVVGLFGGLG
jgi:Flp pilus assembly protein TadB